MKCIQLVTLHFIVIVAGAEDVKFNLHEFTMAYNYAKSKNGKLIEQTDKGFLVLLLPE